MSKIFLLRNQIKQYQGLIEQMHNVQTICSGSLPSALSKIGTRLSYVVINGKQFDDGNLVKYYNDVFNATLGVAGTVISATTRKIREIEMEISAIEAIERENNSTNNGNNISNVNKKNIQIF